MHPRRREGKGRTSGGVFRRTAPSNAVAGTAQDKAARASPLPPPSCAPAQETGTPDAGILMFAVDSINIFHHCL